MASRAVTTAYHRGRFGAGAKAAVLLGFLLLSMLIGLTLAFAPPQLIIVPAVPVLLLGGAAIWMLPEREGIYYAPAATLTVLYLLASAIWPSYLAVNAPGLPWVTPTRLFVLALLLVVVYNVASSSPLRRQMADVMGSLPGLRRVFWIFWFTTLVTLPLSPVLRESSTKLANNLIFWVGSLYLGGWLASRPGFATRAAKALIWTALITAAIGLLEWHMKTTPWFNHIPSFLTVDPGYLAVILSSQARAGTDIYRVHSTFATSLGYAEYMALVLPLLLHFFMEARVPLRKAAMFLGVIMCMLAMYWTNARSGMIGVFGSLFGYTFFRVFRGYLRDRQSMTASSALYAFPVAAAIFAILLVAWPRLHVAVLGGGAQQASSDARAKQWSTGVVIIAKQPLGHGSASSGVTLNYRNSAGDITVDTYYLSMLLEYGVVGFVAFMFFYGWTGWHGFRAFLRAPPGEPLLVGPLAVGIANFLVIKSVLSSEISIPIALLMVGAMFGLAYQEQRGLGAYAAAGPRPLLA